MDTDTLHVDATNHMVGVETNTTVATLHAMGSSYKHVG